MFNLLFNKKRKRRRHKNIIPLKEDDLDNTQEMSLYFENVPINGQNTIGKKTYNSIEELNNSRKKTGDIEKNETETKNIINEYYKLPDINIIKNEIIKDFLKENSSNELMVPLGLYKDNIYGETLESMPNLMVGGTIMTGKSSFVHTLIGTILLTKKPYETKLLICDSKKIEYNDYNDIPHLMTPIINDFQKCSLLLSKIVLEIQNRLELLKQENMKNITIYNENMPIDKRKPSIVIIIDNYDMFGGKEIDDSIWQIAENGWKTNIYLILVSTHPTSEIISALAKSHIPARLCFKVTSAKDSSIFIDNPGASKLSGLGTALYVSRNTSSPINLNVQILSEEEIKRIVEYTKNQQDNDYSFKLTNGNSKEIETEQDLIDDDFYYQVVDFVIRYQKASASLIQRKFSVGYNMAARVIDLLEERNIIGPQNGSKPRTVLLQYDPETGAIVEKNI